MKYMCGTSLMPSEKIYNCFLCVLSNVNERYFAVIGILHEDASNEGHRKSSRCS